jgi:hypothetical protein
MERQQSHSKSHYRTRYRDSKVELRLLHEVKLVKLSVNTHYTKTTKLKMRWVRRVTISVIEI